MPKSTVHKACKNSRLQGLEIPACQNEISLDRMIELQSWSIPRPPLYCARTCPSSRQMPNRAAYAWTYDMNVQIPRIRVESFSAITVLCRSEYSIVERKREPRCSTKQITSGTRFHHGLSFRTSLHIFHPSTVTIGFSVESQTPVIGWCPKSAEKRRGDAKRTPLLTNAYAFHTNQMMSVRYSQCSSNKRALIYLRHRTATFSGYQLPSTLAYQPGCLTGQTAS
jgi:hypothetical protein